MRRPPPWRRGSGSAGARARGPGSQTMVSPARRIVTVSTPSGSEAFARDVVASQRRTTAAPLPRGRPGVRAARRPSEPRAAPAPARAVEADRREHAYRPAVGVDPLL